MSKGRDLAWIETGALVSHPSNRNQKSVEVVYYLACLPQQRASHKPYLSQNLGGISIEERVFGLLYYTLLGRLPMLGDRYSDNDGVELIPGPWPAMTLFVGGTNGLW
jgi:hypothetical protein